VIDIRKLNFGNQMLTMRYERDPLIEPEDDGGGDTKRGHEAMGASCHRKPFLITKVMR
jgi:hypothetical protein